MDFFKGESFILLTDLSHDCRKLCFHFDISTDEC